MDFSDVIPQEVLELYERAGFGRTVGYGKNPAVLVVDMRYGFIDPSYPMATGDMGFRAVEAIRALLGKARARAVPIIFTKVLFPGRHPAELLSLKRTMHKDAGDARGYELVDGIAPRDGEIVIEKTKASAFFGTNLLSTLHYYDVDTLIITGATTSGCLRASVVDAASYMYHVVIPEECTVDRTLLLHKITLFDMHMKYADVVPLSEVLHYLDAMADFSKSRK